MADLVIPQRFCGPPTSGNGGYTAGSLATLLLADRAGLGVPVEVSLRRPPPLDRPMPVVVNTAAGTASATDQELPVATATVVEAELPVVTAVPPEVARAAAADYPGLRTHPFPTCVVCGTGRAPGDGLRVFAGPVPSPDDAVVAATWTPTPSLALPEDPGHTAAALAWAALDCPGAWAADFGERAMVLARMRAVVHALPRVGEEYVVVGRAGASQGRKTISFTSLYDDLGGLVGTAEHLWITVDPATFGR